MSYSVKDVKDLVNKSVANGGPIEFADFEGEHVYVHNVECEDVVILSLNPLLIESTYYIIRDMVQDYI